MKSHVSFLQAAEGRKIEILLSPEDLQRISSAMRGIVLLEGECDWSGEDGITQSNAYGQPLAVASITIGIRAGN